MAEPAVPPANNSNEGASDSSGETWSTARGAESSISSRPSRTPSRSDQVAQWQEHVNLAEFTTNLDHALKAVFPNNNNRSRYSNTFVLLVRWQIGDPRLPVALEIDQLRRLFEEKFYFRVEVFEIPEQRSHLRLSQKINEFILKNGDSKDDLKVFYYAGHSRLTRSKDLLFSSYRGGPQPSNEVSVTWSGVQNTLEQASSDVVILLDCCGAGRVHRGEGNGVTELIAACTYDARANGVGPYSFTSQLLVELRLLASSQASVTIADLYARVYDRMQSYMDQGRENERYPPPVHYFLTEDKHFHRSIELTAMPPHTQNAPLQIIPALKTNTSGHQLKRPRTPTRDSPSPQRRRRTVSHRMSPAAESSSTRPISARSGPHAKRSRGPNDDTRTILFAVRLEETMAVRDLNLDAFKEWLRKIPARVAQAGCRVALEGQFRSDSTLMLLTVPISVWACLKDHPAIIPLGPVKSSNLLCTNNNFNANAVPLKPPPTGLPKRKRKKTYNKYEDEHIADPEATASEGSATMFYPSFRGPAD